MNTELRRLFLVLLTFCSLSAWPLGAQNKCSPDSPASDCTLGMIHDAAFEAEFPRDVEEAVKNANVATTTPDTFAGRIHASHQDFLNMFSFAINKIEESEDGQALIVRFNPLHEGTHLLGLSVTVAKPAISDLVSKAIPEDARSATVEKLQALLGDLDDVTYAASYSLESAKCSWGVPKNRWCWGRSPKTYRQMLAPVLMSVTSATTPPPDLGGEEADRLIALTGTREGSVFSMKLADVPVKNREEVLAVLRQLAAKEVALTQERKTFFEQSGIDKLASLVDNQPQLAATGSYRDPGSYGGPDEAGLSLEFQYGRTNLNQLRRVCEGSVDCVAGKLQAFARTGLPTGKFVFTASYKRRGEYGLDDLGLDSPVPGFTPIDLKRSTEFKARLQWGRLLDTPITGRQVRVDFSADGVRTWDDQIRTENRWVATSTLTLPLGEQMSFPISLNYANRPEFLGEQRHQWGAHLGITYRLPWETRP